MPSYKIHSIKDSEKLSFIIEGDSESALTQKLSGEGHIILSVEKIEIPTDGLFCFEGKKSDGWFIDGKISADDIFEAFEMLTQEYKYSITKLYPESIQDPEKQKKILSELLLSFQENRTKKPEKTIDTTKQEILRYKKILAQLIDILRTEEQKDINMSELKKMEQNNNVSILQLTLRDTLKKLFQKRKNKVLFQKLKPLMKEMKIFVLPDFLFNFFENAEKMSQSLDPLFHPTEIHKNTPKKIENTSSENIKNEYNSIQNNSHIHTFLRKKYRSKISNMVRKNTKNYYFYTLLRQNKLLFFIAETIKTLPTILRTALIVTLLLTFCSLFFGLYNTAFVTTQMMGIFMILIVISLVIQNETV